MKKIKKFELVVANGFLKFQLDQKDAETLLKNHPELFDPWMYIREITDSVNRA